jgi:hypothetical protein
VHQSFEEYLQSLTISPSVLACFKIALVSLFENEESNIESWNANREKNISEINKKIERLYEMLLTIESEEVGKLYQQKLNELILEKKKLETKTNDNKKLNIDVP